MANPVFRLRQPRVFTVRSRTVPITPSVGFVVRKFRRITVQAGDVTEMAAADTEAID